MRMLKGALTHTHSFSHLIAFIVIIIYFFSPFFPLFISTCACTASHCYFMSSLTLQKRNFIAIVFVRSRIKLRSFPRTFHSHSHVENLWKDVMWKERNKNSSARCCWRGSDTHTHSGGEIIFMISLPFKFFRKFVTRKRLQQTIESERNEILFSNFSLTHSAAQQGANNLNYCQKRGFTARV